jgi:hypothetical protein
VTEDLSEAIESIQELEGNETDLWRPALEVIPADGVSVSTLADFLGPETIASSDPTATRIDELQFDLRMGPCWDAVATRQPVLAGHLRTFGSSRWPLFAAAAADEGVGALHAFPMVVGPLALGAIDFYTLRPGELSSEYSRDALTLADAVARVVLKRAIRLNGESDTPEVGAGFSRRLVHQATGVVIAQLNVSPEDALLLIHAHAFSAERSVMAVAEDIVERRLDFSERTGEGDHE